MRVSNEVPKAGRSSGVGQTTWSELSQTAVELVVPKSHVLSLGKLRPNTVTLTASCDGPLLGTKVAKIVSVVKKYV